MGSGELEALGAADKLAVVRAEADTEGSGLKLMVPRGLTDTEGVHTGVLDSVYQDAVADTDGDSVLFTTDAVCVTVGGGPVMVTEEE